MLRYATTPFTLILCLALSACGGGRIRQEDRAAIHTARTAPPKHPARGNVYSDTTSKAISSASIAFGLAGALVGSGIAAANTGAGIRRWETVTKGLPEHVTAALRSEIERQFSARHGLKFPRGGDVDAEINLDYVSFGVEHLGRQQFGAVVSADISMKRLHKGEEGVVWVSYSTMANVPVGGSLEDCKRNPQLYVKALDEAIRQLVTKAVAEY